MSRSGMRTSEMFKTSGRCPIFIETKTHRTLHTNSVVSFADTTAASTLINNFQKKERKKSTEEFEEDLWSHDKKNLGDKEIFVGTEAFLDYYK